MPADSPPGTPGPDASTTGQKRLSGAGLLLSTSVVSSMTLLSRILGLVRDIVFARIFGASLVMDAFIVANRIPNMLRRFFAEGAFSQGFVPVMARYREQHSHDEAREFIDAIAGTFGLLLFCVTLLGVIGAPLLVLLVAPGFVGEDGQFDLAAAMLQFTFPYLFFVSLTAFAGGILNTYGRFAVPAFTPVILNVVLIACALWLEPRLDASGMALAYGVFLAGLAQLVFQVPFLGKLHAIPRPRWNRRHAGVQRVGKLMLPAIFGSSVAQINVLVAGIIASFLGTGKISYLYYSDRLMEFPLGLFSIALATVMLPTLSRQAANRNPEEFSRTVDWSMKLTVLVAVPAAIGLVLLATPLLATMFYGGVFSRIDVEMASFSLQAFAVGLVGFSFVKILAPAFFAHEDTRTPVRYGLVALAVNFSLSLLLVWYLMRAGYEATHVGLAAATSVAGVTQAWLLFRGLKARQLLQHSDGWRAFALRTLAANAAMIGFLVWTHRPIDWWLDAGTLAQSVQLAIEITGSVVVYFGTLAVCGLRLSQFRLANRQR